MGKRSVPVSYKCPRPCQESGCPGHQMTFHRNDALIIMELDGVPKYYMDYNQFNEFIKASKK